MSQLSTIQDMYDFFRATFVQIFPLIIRRILSRAGGIKDIFLQNRLTEASDKLYKASKYHVFLTEIIIHVPETWINYAQ